MQDNNFEQTIKSEKIYEGKIVTLKLETVELPNKKYTKREIIEHARGVGIIALASDDTMFIVEQYRKAINQNILEIPAGIVEANEEPRIAAQRELQEEIGYKANTLNYLMDIYPSPGFSNEKLSIFLAKDLTSLKLAMDDTEFLNVHRFTIKELKEMIDNYEIKDAKTVIAILIAEKIINNEWQ